MNKALFILTMLVFSISLYAKNISSLKSSAQAKCVEVRMSRVAGAGYDISMKKCAGATFGQIKCLEVRMTNMAGAGFDVSLNKCVGVTFAQTRCIELRMTTVAGAGFDESLRRCSK
jgi:hypothetical protein